MKKLISSLFSLLTAAVILTGCRMTGPCPIGPCGPASQWDSPDHWYQTGQTISEDQVDVFYILSTDVASAHDADGQEIYHATLSAGERVAMDKDYSYVYRKIFGDSFNFYAPYYHQFTINAIFLPEAEFQAQFKDVENEICEAFDYYMAHYNNGRRFILAGFSQGAMLSLTLLRHLTDEQYSRMVAAYVIGYRVSEEDLTHPHIRAAAGEDDLGVTISFNSVTDPDAIFPFVTDGAAVCINPLNWHTDSTPAELRFRDDTATVSVDPDHHVLVVKGLDADKYPVSPLIQDICKKGNLHSYDIQFYTGSIRENARKRAYFVIGHN